MPAAPLPVIVNAAGGSASRAGDSLREIIQSAFDAAGQPIVLELVPGEELQAALERHTLGRRIAVGGGDGTLASGAAAALRTGAELAILPLGTRNHFARQLGIPLKIDEAARLAATGAARRIDVGQAGEPVTLSIRPERVRLNGHSESCVNRFSGRVAEFIYLGDHVRVRLEVCGKADFFVKQPIAELDPALAVGDVVPLGWAVEHARALDPIAEAH